MSNPNTTINFDIHIDRQAQEYRTRVFSPLCGEGRERFMFPLDEAELTDFLSSFDLATADTLQVFGLRLFDALFVGEVRDCWLRSVSAASQSSVSLRIRLNLTDTPALAQLPWEYLYDGAANRFVAQSVQTPLVRYLDLPQPIPALAVSSPLRILVLIASPTDFQTLDVEREWNNLKSAMADLEQSGAIVLDRLDDATLLALQRKLRQRQYHIFHFIGHGAFDEHTQEGILVLEDRAGKGQIVSGKQLGVLLHNHPSLRLVVLNSCDDARVAATNAFTGIAQQLVRQEVPAVIAMQFALTDEAANHFSHTFYAALADRYAVDKALTEARVAMATEDGNAEWGAPVLYLRAPDAYIFTAAQPPVATVTWHRRGALWLGAGLLGVILLIGLGYLLLHNAPALQSVLGIMGGLLAIFLSWLGLREDKTLAVRLSRWIGAQWPMQAGMGLTLVLSLVLWGWVGLPIGRDLVCGPLGCPAPGVQRFAIGEWENLTPGVSKFESRWTDKTRKILYAKLSQVEGLQGVALDSPLAEDVNRYLDWWVQGDFQKATEVELSAQLVGKGGVYRSDVSVHGPVDEESSTIDAQILDLQSRLAQEIMQAFGIQVTAAISTAIRNTPTNNPEALRLNNEGVAYYEQGDLRAAQSLLQAALALDTQYADAHNNLANVLAARGEITAALPSIQRAIDLNPRNTSYRFNLAAIYETAGDLAAAAQAYQAAIDLDPGFVRAYNNLGLNLLQQGQSEEAEAILRRGLRIQATRPSLHKNLGRVYLAQGKLQAAIQELQRAIAIIELSSPQNPDLVYYDALYYLAVAQDAAGQRAAACAALDDYSRVAGDDQEQTRIEGAQQLRAKLACS